MDINQIISNVLYLIIIAMGSFIYKEWKAHSKALLDFKAKEEARAEQLLGKQNYEDWKQAVVDAVYKAEQLGKEQIDAKWTGLDKHDKVIEWVAGKTGLSDSDIFDIIKTTVGKINSK